MVSQDLQEDVPSDEKVNKPTDNLATHALQIFFRSLYFNCDYPCAYFLTKEVTALQLNRIFWMGIRLHVFGFEIMFCCCDGSSSNRSFMMLNIDDTNSCSCNNINTTQKESSPPCEATKQTCRYITNCDTFWNVFSDPKPLKSPDDSGIKDLENVVKYFEDWKIWLSEKFKTKAQQAQHFISWQTKFDLDVSTVMVYLKSIFV